MISFDHDLKARVQGGHYVMPLLISSLQAKQARQYKVSADLYTVELVQMIFGAEMKV